MIKPFFPASIVIALMMVCAILHSQSTSDDMHVAVASNDAEAVVGSWVLESKEEVVVHSMLGNLKQPIQVNEYAGEAPINTKAIEIMMDMYADDADSVSNNDPDLTGKAAIRNYQEKEFDNMVKGITYYFETIDVFGDETEVTQFEKTIIKDAHGRSIGKGKYLSVFKKK